MNSKSIGKTLLKEKLICLQSDYWSSYGVRQQKPEARNKMQKPQFLHACSLWESTAEKSLYNFMKPSGKYGTPHYEENYLVLFLSSWYVIL